jgi:hypothetical protein
MFVPQACARGARRPIRPCRCPCVATGEPGYPFHRAHRYPGTRPVARGRFFALTAARRRMRRVASQREARRVDVPLGSTR